MGNNLFQQQNKQQLLRRQQQQQQQQQTSYVNQENFNKPYVPDDLSQTQSNPINLKQVPINISKRQLAQIQAKQQAQIKQRQIQQRQMQPKEQQIQTQQQRQNYSTQSEIQDTNGNLRGPVNVHPIMLLHQHNSRISNLENPPKSIIEKSIAEGFSKN